MSIIEKIRLMFASKDKASQPEEISAAEQFLSANTTWPVKIRGTLSIIDAGSIDDEGFPHWTIGEFDIEDIDGGILVEFKGDTLKNAGITDEFEYDDPMTLFINSSFEEYYQVESIGS